MTWLYISLTWLAAVFVANEIGLGRMNPYTGVFVIIMLAWNTVRALYKWERKCK